MVQAPSSQREPGAHSARPGGAQGRKRSAPSTPLGLLREALIVLVVALVLASLLRAFIVQAFVIPSGSMENTLQCDRFVDTSCDADVSDRVVVSKLSKHIGGISRGEVAVFSDPGGWLTDGEGGTVTDTSGVGGAVRRGLQFVGVVPNDATGHLIKRVVGIGGDHVYTDAQGNVYVNGDRLDETYLKPGTPTGSSCAFDVTVPVGSVWVMGDNRGNSRDSRFHLGDAGHGFVPDALVTGRAVARVWPIGRIGGLGIPQTFSSVPDASGGQQAQQGSSGSTDGAGRSLPACSSLS